MSGVAPLPGGPILLVEDDGLRRMVAWAPGDEAPACVATADGRQALD